MTDTVTIAEEPPDGAETRALIQAAFDHSAALYPPENNYALDVAGLMKPGVWFLVARVGGVARGCVALARQEDGTGPYGEVKTMFVAPEARGLGLAKALMTALEERAGAVSLPVLRLETGTAQGEAISLYAKVGFTRRGPFGDYTDDPYSVYMEKCLG